MPLQFDVLKDRVYMPLEFSLYAVRAEHVDIVCPWGMLCLLRGHYLLNSRCRFYNSTTH